MSVLCNVAPSCSWMTRAHCLSSRARAAATRLACRFATAALTVGFAVPLAAQRATLEHITRLDSLPNGMQVIVIENHAVPLATAELVVRTGAMSQTADDQGVPHLYEHMLFRGYHGGNEAFQMAAAGMHASYNGTTSEEMVTYFLTLPSERTSNAIGVLADLVRDPHFEREDLMRERFIVLGEMQRNYSEPEFHLSDQLGRLLWGAAWPRKNTLGDQTALLSVTPEHLEEIFKRYYVPNETALVVTGDVDAVRVFQTARDRFAGWKRQPDPYVAFPVPAVPSLDSSYAIVLTADVNDVSVEVEWRGPSVRDQAHDTYAADVLCDVVDDPRSEFQKRLVDSGLFHSAELEYESLAHVGPLIFHGTTTVANLAAALTTLQAEIDFMASDTYFDATSLAAAAKRRRVRTALSLEEGAGMAHTVGYWWAVAGLDYFYGYADSLSVQRPTDLQAFATRYLVGHHFVIGALTRPADASPIAVMLQQYIAMSEDK